MRKNPQYSRQQVDDRNLLVLKVLLSLKLTIGGKKVS